MSTNQGLKRRTAARGGMWRPVGPVYQLATGTAVCLSQ